jgi:hypothetical protein
MEVGMRRFGVTVGMAPSTILLAGAGVGASQASPGSGSMSSSVNRQLGVWRSVPASTTSQSFHAVPSLRASVCAIGEVAVTVSLSGAGAPMLVQVRQDGGRVLAPGAVRFAPGVSGRSGAFTFLARTQPFEANDHHLFQVEWRSPTGATTTLLAETMNLTYQRGSQGC